mgnify:CR=1 FL=1
MGARVVNDTTTYNFGVTQATGPTNMQFNLGCPAAEQITATVGAAEQAHCRVRFFVNMQTFFGGSVSTNMYRLFANAEYKPGSWATLNLGAYGEHEDDTGWSWSPRAAWLFNAG